MRDEDGDRVPQTEAEWAEAMATFQKNRDWSEAMAEDRRRTSESWVASWQAAIVKREGVVTFFDPAFVWPYRGSRKDAFR